MKKIVAGLISILLITVSVKDALAAPIPNDPQYILVRKSGGYINTCCIWNYTSLANFNAQGGIDEIREKIFGAGASQTKPDTANVNRRLGAEFILAYLDTSTQTEDFFIDQLTSAAVAKDFPIMFKLDGSLNYSWGTRKDLWNFWDPNSPGYNPENINNVERTGWDPSTAIQKCYVGYANQWFPPVPNLGSPAFISAKQQKIARIVGKIATWYKSLPDDKKYLLAGIDLDTELGGPLLDCDGTNAKMDPPQLGYAAAASFGIKTSGNVTISDINSIVNKHASIISKTAKEAGLAQGVDLSNKIYYHGAVYYPNGAGQPGILSYKDMINLSARPGWSFYAIAGNPSQDQDFRDAVSMSNGIGWGALEWNPNSPDVNSWITSLNNTLNYSNNMVVNVSNWDGDGGIVVNPNALQAIKTVLGQQPCYLPASNLAPSGTIAPGTYTLTWTKNSSTYTSNGVRINDLNSQGFTPPSSSCNTTAAQNGDVCANNIDTGQFQYTFQPNHSYDFWVWTGNNCGGRDVHTTVTISGQMAGDLNNDNKVDINDYNLLKNNFGKAGIGDINGNGKVDIFDYNTLITNYGK